MKALLLFTCSCALSLSVWAQTKPAVQAIQTLSQAMSTKTVTKVAKASFPTKYIKNFSLAAQQRKVLMEAKIAIPPRYDHLLQGGFPLTAKEIGQVQQFSGVLPLIEYKGFDLRNFRDIFHVRATADSPARGIGVLRSTNRLFGASLKEGFVRPGTLHYDMLYPDASNALRRFMKKDFPDHPIVALRQRQLFSEAGIALKPPQLHRLAHGKALPTEQLLKLRTAFTSLQDRQAYRMYRELSSAFLVIQGGLKHDISQHVLNVINKYKAKGLSDPKLAGPLFSLGFASSGFLLGFRQSVSPSPLRSTQALLDDFQRSGIKLAQEEGEQLLKSQKEPLLGHLTSTEIEQLARGTFHEKLFTPEQLSKMSSDPGGFFKNLESVMK